MHTAIAALPPFHPWVLQASAGPLLVALVPLYAPSLTQDATLSNPKRTPEVIARVVIRRVLKLLEKHQGCVPISNALRFVMCGDEARELTAIQERKSVRLLELLIGCSGLIVADCAISTLSLHPEWSRRFCERYEEQELTILARTAHWDSHFELARA
jgi:hypothetical protein